MHPVVGEHRRAVDAAGLGDLVLVVREDQVVAAPVDIDGHPQGGVDHRRALDMPAGPAGAPGAVPHRLAGLGRLPQHEVGGVTLVGGDLDPGAGDHVLHRPAGQLAVVGEAFDAEQHMALGGVGAAVLDQPADHPLDIVDVSRGPGGEVGRQHPKRAHVGVVDGGEAVGDGADRHALRRGGGVDLVVHVGDVAGIDHGLGAVDVAQHAKQQVEGHRRPTVADVGVGIDRRAADIHRHPLGIGGNEPAFFAGHGVMQGEIHRA